MTNLDSVLKSRDITLPIKVQISQSHDFPSSHVWMWELDYKEDWALKNWWFWTVMVEKTLESPLDSRENKPVNAKGNQSWILIGRTDAEAEAPILCHLNVKNWLIGKDPDAGKDWGQEEKGMTEDEMVGWYHWFNGHEFEQALGVNKDREAWRVADHGVTKSQTQTRDWIATTIVKSSGIFLKSIAFLPSLWSTKLESL